MLPGAGSVSVDLPDKEIAMAAKQEIEILISDEGYVQYHIKGIKGKKCVDISKALAKDLGGIENETFTSEYYEEENKAKNINKQKQSSS